MESDVFSSFTDAAFQSELIVDPDDDQDFGFA